MRAFEAKRLLQALLLGSLISHAIAQQDFPTRPIRIIVPASPGTAPDATARIVANALGPRMGQAVIVENVPGAGGNIASVNVARSAPDGYTLLLQFTPFVVNPSLYKKVPYDPIKDFQPVILAAQGAPMMLVINPSMADIATVKDLVALSKAKPGRLNYASPGVGSPNHLAMEIFKRMSGADFTHVPYKTPASMVTAILAGDVTTIFSSATVAIPQFKAGKYKVLATTGPERTAHTPNVPTMAESGYPDFRVDVWSGFLAPAGTGLDLVRRLNAGFAAVLNTAATKEGLAQQGQVATTSTPEEFAAVIKTDLAYWAKVLKDTGITLD